MNTRLRPARAVVVTFGQIVPPSGGIAVRSVMVARCLAAMGFAVHLLSVGESNPALDLVGRRDAVATAQTAGLPDGVELTALPSRPAFALGTQPRRSLRFAISRSDVVIVESALLLPAVVLAGPRRPIVWDTNELETLHYGRLPTSPSVLLKRLVWYLLERWSTRKVDVVVAISAVEALHWARLFPGSREKLLVADHAVPSEPRLAAPESERSASVVLVADCRAKHNYAAAKWTLEHLAPVLAGRARLVLAGSGTDRMAPGSPDVELLGFVDDVSDVIARAQVCIAPLLSGAGVKTKMLDYVRQGCRVLATPVAMEGIEDCPGVTVAGLGEFPQALLGLLDTPEDADHAMGRRAAQAQWYEEHCGQAHLTEQWTAILERVGLPAGNERVPPPPA